MGDFSDLMQFIEDEAQAEGPEAVAELRAFDVRFRLAAELLDARRRAHMTQREPAAATGAQQAASVPAPGVHPRLHQVLQDATQSEIEGLKAQLYRYE
jgi:hypothetical protein